jgi:RHS repeat-associated protein
MTLPSKVQAMREFSQREKKEDQRVHLTCEISGDTDWQAQSYTITCAYDPSGRRIAKSYDGQTVATYLYDGGHILADYDGNGALLHKYIYGPGVDQPVCMIDVSDSNATYYYHYDGLGSVIALSDEAGDTVEVYEYGIFGQVAASDPNHPNRVLFTGREFDSETGLYYYRARYYNPYIGRFLQTDPIGYGDTMNVYSYCANNPLQFVDPTGSYRIMWAWSHPTAVIEQEKKWTLDSMTRVHDICNERIREINQLLVDLSWCGSEESGSPHEHYGDYEDQMRSGLENLRTLLRKIRDGIDSTTEGLIVAWLDFGYTGEGGEYLSWPRYPTIVYNRRTRSLDIALEWDLGLVSFDGEWDDPTLQMLDATTLHELSHKYGTEDAPLGSRDIGIGTRWWFPWVNPHTLEALISGKVAWLQWYMDLWRKMHDESYS